MTEVNKRLQGLSKEVGDCKVEICKVCTKLNCVIEGTGELKMALAEHLKHCREMTHAFIEKQAEQSSCIQAMKTRSRTIIAIIICAAAVITALAAVVALRVPLIAG